MSWNHTPSGAHDERAAALTIDYYSLLGLRSDASDAEIKRAYRELALKLHPDVSPGTASTALFKQITEAYEVLSDPEKRRTLDNPPPPPPPPPPSPRPTARSAQQNQPDLVACDRCGTKTSRSLLARTAVWAGAENWCRSCARQRDWFFTKVKFGITAAIYMAFLGFVIWIVVGPFHGGVFPVSLVVGSGAYVLIREWIKIRDDL